MAKTLDVNGRSHELASPAKRFIGALIDGVLAGAVSIVPFVGIAVGIAYELTKDALPFLNGQSIGKRAMGIRAVKKETAAPLTNDYGAAVIRHVSLWIPFFNILDALMVFSDSRERFGDKWAKTVVIDEK